MSVEQQIQKAYKLIISGDLKKSKDILEQLNSNNKNVLFLLGTIELKLKNYDESIKLFKKNIKINKEDELTLNNLGIAYKSIKKLNEAKEVFKKILKINNKNLDANLNLINTLIEAKQFQNAYEEIKLAEKNFPNQDKIIINKIICMNNLHLHEEIINSEEKKINFETLKLDPLISDIFANIYLAKKNYEKTLFYVQNLEKFKFNNFTYLKKITDFYIQLSKIDKIKEYINKINTKYKNELDALLYLIWVYKRIDLISFSILKLIKLKKLYPNNNIAELSRISQFPGVYINNKEIIKFRNRYAQYLNYLEKIIDNNRDNLKSILNFNNFLFAYSAGDNVENKNLQIQYSKILEKVSNKIEIKTKLKKQNEKIKIGFISAHFREHTVSNLFINWVFCLDKKDYNISIFHFGYEDWLTEKIKNYSDNFFNLNDSKIEDSLNTIIEENLDILIYMDHGMIQKLQIFPQFKLAKIQCIAWGHPITSGSKNIDYFLSSELMENNNSSNHYSEKLIPLNGIGIKYDITSIKNYNINPELKKESGINFLCLQNLQKILPDNDEVFFKILKNITNSKIIFIKSKNEYTNQKFFKRLFLINKEFNGNLLSRIYFKETMDRDIFLENILRSDVILDTMFWSGGNTTFEAIYFNKPVVCFAGNNLRSSHTSGILKFLNLNDLIANTTEDYINICKKLCSDEEFKSQIIKRLNANKNKIFDESNLKAFKEFLIDLKKNKHI